MKQHLEYKIITEENEDELESKVNDLLDKHDMTGPLYMRWEVFGSMSVKGGWFYQPMVLIGDK